MLKDLMDFYQTNFLMVGHALWHMKQDASMGGSEVTKNSSDINKIYQTMSKTDLISCLLSFHVSDIQHF